jgi:hypothetical protein
MLDLVSLLHLCNELDVLRTHIVLSIQRREDPSYSLERERLGKDIDLEIILILYDLEPRVLSNLLGLIDSFNVDSHSIRVVGVFRVIAVQEAYSLGDAVMSLPVVLELLHFLDVHDRHIVNVSVGLATDHDRGRDAFVTHALRIGSMPSRTVPLDLVLKVHGEHAVLAFLVVLVKAFAFLLDLCHIVLKGCVFDSLYFDVLI